MSNICPKCLKDDQVQKVSLFFSDSTDLLDLDNEITPQNNIGVFKLDENSLVEKLAPPPSPKKPGNQFVHIGLMGIVGGIIGFTGSVLFIIILQPSDYYGWMCLFANPIFGIIVGGVYGSTIYNKEYSTHYYQLKAWQTWENLYYCNRDNILFNPQTSESSDDLYKLFRVEEFSGKSFNSNALEKFISEINLIELNKTAEEYYKQGEVLMAKNEFDSAILEFVKVIRISSPEEKWYPLAKKKLRGMGFSEADIRQVDAP